MKILSVSGENIASLAAPFEVNFDKPPLSDVGIFAITGPTGSGKSSIIDAICLALYNKVPRYLNMEQIRFVDSVDDELTARDSRWILRRGSDRAVVDVEFIGQDGLRYKAHWEVHRAKQSGKLQSVKMRFLCMDSGEECGDQNITITLNEIEKRIGLSFDQFRRSVVLAQGDFAAFLKSRSDERGALLEQLTGTEIYSKISKAAYERYSQEKSSIEATKQKIDINAANLRTDEDLALLEEDITKFEKSATEKKAALELQQKVNKAFEILTRWQSDHDKAVLDLELLNKKLAEFDALRTDIKLYEQLIPSQTKILKSAEIEERLKELNTDIERIKELITDAEVELKELTKSLKNLHSELTVAESDGAKKDALIKEAIGLDQEISSLKNQLSVIQERLHELIKEQATQATALQKLTNELTIEEQQINTINEFVKRHQSLMDLVPEWRFWESKIDFLIKSQGLKKQYAKAISLTKEELSICLKSLESNKKQMSNADIKLTKLKGELNSLRSKTRNQNIEQVDDDLQDAHERRSTILKLIEWHAQLLYFNEQHETGLSEVKILQGNIQKHQRKVKRLQKKLEKSEIQYEEVMRLYKQSQSSMDLESLRGDLRSGDPCPLCGSEDHPYSELFSHTEQLLDGFKSRVAELEAEKQHTQKQLASEQALQHAEEEQGVEYLKRANDSRKNFDDLQKTWKDCLESLTSSINVNPLLLEKEELDKLLSFEQSIIKRANQQSQDYRKQQTELSSLHEGIEQHQEMISALTNERTAFEKNEQKLKQDIDRYTEDLKTAENDVTTSSAEIQKVLEFKDADKAEQFREKCRTIINELNEKVAKRELAEKKSQELKHSIDLDVKSIDALKASSSTLGAEIKEMEKQSTNLSDKRKSLFEGTIAAFEKQYKDLLESLKKSIAQSERRKYELDLNIKTNTKQLSNSTAEIKELAAADQKIKKDLASQLDELKIDFEVASRITSLDVSYINKQRDLIGRTETEYAECERFLKRCVEEIDKVKEECVGYEKRDEVIKSIVILETEIAELTKDIHKNEQILRDEDEKMKAFGILRDELKELEPQLHFWKSVADLIGSSDGKKFRSFAQGITLDFLLQAANERLQDLYPRYYLRRNAQTLDFYVIDAEMDDDLRSISSLSGGESFLVSLALALALSSIHASNIKISTLFIDEGIANLDEKTVELALDTLDNLQSYGCQVGLISHVHFLSERIHTQVKVIPSSSGRSSIEIIS